jgi:hypothetical protein
LVSAYVIYEEELQPYYQNKKLVTFIQFAANWPATNAAYKFSSNKVRLKSTKWEQN